MELAGGVLTFLFVLFAGLMFYLPVYRNHYDTYLIRLKVRPLSNEPAAFSQPKESAILDFFKTAGKGALSTFPQLIDSRSAALMVQANYRTSDHICIFIGIKLFFVAAVMLPLVLCTAGSAVVFCLPVAFCAWMIPNFFLAVKANKRQTAIILELPTIVDLLIVCAQAGLGLMMSIEKVNKECKDTCPNLCEELEQMLNDVKMFAKQSSVALNEMGERCGVEELSSITSTLVSCEMKGSELTYPLKQIAIALRDRTRRKKEEEASKVPVKMVPVIMLFIMPLILCPMLGPAVIIILQALLPAIGSAK